jgi:hypothetical protein
LVIVIGIGPTWFLPPPPLFVFEFLPGEHYYPRTLGPIWGLLLE